METTGSSRGFCSSAMRKSIADYNKQEERKMVTEKDFLTEFNGHGNAYSSYMVIDVELKDLIKVLNDIDPDMCVGSGQVSDNGRSIYFEICKELPDLICEITEKLH